VLGALGTVLGDRREPTRRTRSLLAAGALLCLLALAVAVAWPGTAGSAPFRVILLGGGVNNLKPDCPSNDQKQCQTIGRVTGFQSLAGDFVKPFQAPFQGKVISWSVSLGKPFARATDDHGNEVAFFNEFFGRPSQARISVVRKVEGSRPPQYKLIRHSPIQVLNPYFGQRVEFALDHPLGVAQGDQVALTIPTWAPAFFHSAACELGPDGFERDPDQCSRFSSQNAWRASRRDGRCVFNASGDALQAQIDKSHPQQKIQSEKEYGCYYRSARLLYSATVVKKPRRR
jgi:hypothetical protein